MTAWLLSSLIIFSPFAQAGSCSKIDYSEGMHPRNQGNTQWCYAYAAADLLSFRTGQDVSAVDVALNYTDGPLNSFARWTGASETDYKNGWTSSALQHTIEKGICLEDDFRSDDIAVAHLNSAGEIDFDLRNISQEITDLEKSATEVNQIDALLKGPAEVEPTCQELQKSAGMKAVRALFPLLDFEKSLSTYLGSKRWNIVRKFQQAACDGKRKPLEKKPQVVTEGCELLEVCSTSKDKLLATIDDQLEHKNIAAISYDPAKLSYGMVTGKHAVTVVGREPDESTGECRYLIRNSTGAKNLCEEYGNSRLKCDRNGFISVPASLMKQAIGSVTYLH